MILKNKRRMPEQNVLDAFFVLLRAGLWGTTPDPAFFVSLSRTKWQALLALAQKQAVLGLIYAGISRLPKEVMPDQQLLLRLYGFSEQIRKSNAKVVAVTQEVCGWFEEAGLEPIILKGMSVGAFYAEPDLRQSGDLDLFFHRDYEKVVSIVQARGIFVELDTNHDKFWYQGVLIELHSRPFRPLYPIADLDLSPVWQKTSVGRYRVLNLKANALLLLLHPAVHFLEAGLGLRQLCDWAVFVHYNVGSPELEEAWNLLREQDLEVFGREFTALAVEILHLELQNHNQWTRTSKQNLRKQMLRELLRMGNFGNWQLPKPWELGKWFVYGKQKIQYALRVYSFCPKWFWKRLPKRFLKMISREFKKVYLCLLLLAAVSGIKLKAQDSLFWKYRVEAVTTVGKGTYAPLWLTANQYGWGSTMPNAAAVRAGLFGEVPIQRYGHLASGIELSGAYHFPSRMVMQQMYLDLGWKQLNLSLGLKERSPFLRSDLSLSSGTLVEDVNARPVPQARLELTDYVPVPWTQEWLGLKGYVAYGKFTDSDWQEDFVAAGQRFVRGAYYHSKGALLRIGNQEKRPWMLELGLQMATQFGGAQYRKTASEDAQYEFGVPIDWKTLVRVFLAMQGGGTSTRGDQLNAEGNTVGAWLGRFVYDFSNGWKLQAYAEHYFEDESEMFFQYGMWRDGLLGIDLTLPKNRWVDRVVWEGLASDDQAGPILYEWFDASFPGIQISACDNYYNHGFYGGWQHWGLGMGHPLLPGPAYNADHSIRFRSNRVRAHHIGISGSPFRDWSYRMKISFTRHWGTYNQPLKEVTRQTSGLAEVTYQPKALTGWSFSAALAGDKGGLIGNSIGGMITVKKEGVF